MRRYRIDQACALPMAVLERAGVFDTGSGDRSWRCVWRAGATLVSSLRARGPADAEMSCGLRLDVTIQQADGRRVQHEYRIPVYAPIGQRRSFLCPLFSDGTSCLRRCRVLYRPPSTESFGCRQCHRLTPARRQGPRMTFPDLAAELATAERDLRRDASLAALLRAVERVAAARDAMATVLRAEIEKSADAESLRAAVEVALQGPQPTMRQVVRGYTKLRRVLREDLRDIRDVAFPEPEALRFEVSLWSTAE